MGVLSYRQSGQRLAPTGPKSRGKANVEKRPTNRPTNDFFVRRIWYLVEEFLVNNACAEVVFSG